MRALELLKKEKMWQFIKLVTNMMIIAVHCLGFERYRDFDDLPMDADIGQNNDDEMDSLDSDYDDRNFRIDD